MSSAWGVAFGVAWGISWGTNAPSSVGPPKITAAGGGGQHIQQHHDFIIHKHEPKPYIYPFKRNMENQDRQDIADILAMLADSGLLD